jgi:hypothetical protein
VSGLHCGPSKEAREERAVRVVYLEAGHF